MTNDSVPGAGPSGPLAIMLIAFAQLVMASALSPVLWFVWWILADLVESSGPPTTGAAVVVEREERAA